MAAPGDAPPSSVDQKSPNPVPQVEQPTVNDHQDTKIEVVKESSPTSVFFNSEPIREEQVQNAVKFLSHPRVRGSPVMHRRSFLERKGLTKEEIDEAFRRVPDPTPNVMTTEPVAPNQDGQTNTSANVQPQAPTQVLQSNPVVPVDSISKMGIMARFHWSYALLTVGFLAVSGAGMVVLFKNAIIPKLKSWIRKVALEEEERLLKKKSGKPSIVEEAAAAARAAATASADVACASRQMLMTKSEEKKLFETLISTLNALVNEMKSMRNSIHKLQSGQSVSRRIAAERWDDQRVLETSSRVNQPISNARSIPRPKPWDVGPAQLSSTNILQTNENSNQLIADDTLPWWQRKNLRITENKAGDENKLRYSNVLGKERPVQWSWVPPQPPPVAMPEAAAAIRQPKKPFSQKDQNTDDDLLAHSPNVSDELQRITKTSESGGTIEVYGDNSPL